MASSDASVDQPPENGANTDPSEHSIDAKGDDAPSYTVDLASLQRELEELRTKVTALERASEDDVLDEDTDEEMPEFVDPDISGDRYHENWLNWTARRKVAKEIIRKVDRMKQRNKEKRDRGPIPRRHNGAGTPELTLPLPEPTCDPSTLTPILDKMPWNEFKSHKLPSPSKAVIEVLIGRSDPAWPFDRSSVMRNYATSGTRTIPYETATLESAIAGQSELPERIRINSPLLLSIIGCLQSEWKDLLFGLNESVVLLRPFKILKHNHQKLQEIYEALKRKHTRTPITSDHCPQESAVAEIEAESKNLGGEHLHDEPALDGITDEATSETALQHMHVLMEFMMDFVMARQKYVESEVCQKVAFSDMWLLFKPGDNVFQMNGTQAYRVYAIQSPEHKAKAPWDEKTVLDHPFEPPPPPGAGDSAPGPWRSSIHIGDDVPFRIWCVHIDSDGFSLGPVSMAIDIVPFVGEKPVIELPLIPLRFRTQMLESALCKYGYKADSSLGGMIGALVTRGQEFVSMNRIRHAYYKGPAHKVRNRLEGQVVVDITHAYHPDRGNTPPPAPPQFYYWARGVLPIAPPPDQQHLHCTADCCAGDTVWQDRAMDELLNVEFRHSLIPTERTQTPSIAAAEHPIAHVMAAHENKLIAESDYLIMSERVFGFVLQSRKWMELDLGYLSTVNYSKLEDTTSRLGNVKVERTAFDELVLPPGHREVILSLVAQHFRDEANHEVDIFKGKGKGLILLLHGAPGVGKTSTAEGVAEAFKKPLLQITCGDLGSTAREVEEALARNFELASRWDCVLLLDEADVFLASRSRADSGSDLNRNALVAVFLRVLEYYTGILFLTTNRIGDFDEAFASRVHVSLEYPQLTKVSTTSILKLNIRMIRKRFAEAKRRIEIDEVDISASFLDYWRENEKARLNGRQIRNACQTALALAEFEAQGGSHEAVLDPDATVHLQASHFDTILKAYLDFNKYLKDIYGVTQDERATEKGYRAPEIGSAHTVDPMLPTSQYGAPQPNAFPGMHLYQQKPQIAPTHQMHTPGQPVFQPQPQGQQGYYLAPQQGYPQNFNASLPYHPQPALRNGGQSLPDEHVITQSGNDTSAGHDPQSHAPYAYTSGSQYSSGLRS